MEWLLGTKYKIWTINSKSDPKLYLWENWEKLLPYINELVELAEKETFIRTFQSYEFENKWLGFGRMKWSLDNNKKWTTKYQTNQEEGKNLIFYSTEVWPPSWDQCLSSNKSPNLYLKIYSNKESID